jgi:hypothetical protein
MANETCSRLLHRCQGGAALPRRAKRRGCQARPR